MFDVLITGGTVLDGTGGPARRADVGITGDTITAIGDLSACAAATCLPAVAAAKAGRLPLATSAIVAPGFIDTHSHSDAYLLLEPSAPSKIFQGITTEVVGNCGASAAPITDAGQMPSDWADKKFPGTWTTVAEYRALLEQVKPAPNVVFQAGHNTLRRGVVGHENRPATPDEMRRMTALLEQSLDEGARGLSTGLVYPPGLFAPPEEIFGLARVAARHGGFYTSHMRSESGGLLESLDETIRVGRETGCTVQVSHLKVGGRSNWHLIDGALERIHRAQNEGLRVAADRYPYTSSWTELDSRLPDWALEGGRDAILGRLRDPDTRARIRVELKQRFSDDYWQTVTVGSTEHPDNKRFRGVPVSAVAETLQLDPVDAYLHVLDTDELRTSAFFFGMSEDNMRRILREPYVMIGTDASIRSPRGPLSEGNPHPRAYGTFPRFIRMCLDEDLLPLPEAVRKMTGLAADQFGLKDRGIIAEGRKADLVIFDPDAVTEKTTYAEPHQLAEGIATVIVNGVVTLAEGSLTGQRGGRFL